MTVHNCSLVLLLYLAIVLAPACTACSIVKLMEGACVKSQYWVNH